MGYAVVAVMYGNAAVSYFSWGAIPREVGPQGMELILLGYVGVGRVKD